MLPQRWDASWSGVTTPATPTPPSNANLDAVLRFPPVGHRVLSACGTPLVGWMGTPMYDPVLDFRCGGVILDGVVGRRMVGVWRDVEGVVVIRWGG